MGAIPIITLIAQYGVPFVQQIVSLWKKQQPDNVEAQEWDTLLATLAKTYESYIKDAEEKASK